MRQGGTDLCLEVVKGQCVSKNRLLKIAHRKRCIAPNYHVHLAKISAESC